MKKAFLVLMICMLCLAGCTMDENAETKEVASEKYTIGDEIDFGGICLNVYKIDDNENELYLMAQSNIAITAFSDSAREMKYLHNYEGSLIEEQVNGFVCDLENTGVVVKDSGIIDKDDLIDLGFVIDGLNGSKYRFEDAPEFVKIGEHFWVDGYCKYDTYAWVCSGFTLTTEKCENEYGVRPIIVIDAAEVDKLLS